MNDKKYRAGIIGCGRVAGLLEDDKLRVKPCTHAGAYLGNPSIDLVACCSRTQEKLDRFSEKFHINNKYNCYKDMIQNEQLDIVSICAYTPTRYEMVKCAAENKVRIIFCEKAMSTSLDEAEKMIKICKKHGSVLMVNYTRRWSWQFNVIAKWINAGRIGRLQSINGIFSGDLIHTGTHMFDALRYFAGNVVTVYGNLFFYKNEKRIISEDQDGAGYILFENGIFATIHGLRRKYFIFELDIFGEEGRIRVGNGLFELWTRGNSIRYEGFNDLFLQSIEKEKIDKWNSWDLVVQDIVDILSGKEQINRSSGEDAKASLEIALAFYVSHKKKKPVHLPLKTYRKLKVISR